MIEQQFTKQDSPLGLTLVLKPEFLESGKSFRLLQLTDCHLGESAGERLAGMDTDESLDRVLDEVTQRMAAGEHYDLVLATGDLANHESAAAYRRLSSKLDGLGTPSAWLPGNHDNYRLMRDTVGEASVPKMVVLGNWHIILLDSAVPGSVGGRIGDRQMRALQQQLKFIDPDAHIVVALHHQPIPIGSEWLDFQKVEDGDALLETLAGDDRIKAVIWGHVHQEFETRVVRVASARFMSTPSTCIQFAPQQNNFKLHDNAPGYRWISLGKDGQLETGVERLEGIDLAQDLQSSGY